MEGTGAVVQDGEEVESRKDQRLVVVRGTEGFYGNGLPLQCGRGTVTSSQLYCSVVACWRGCGSGE